MTKMRRFGSTPTEAVSGADGRGTVAAMPDEDASRSPSFDREPVGLSISVWVALPDGSTPDGTTPGGSTPDGSTRRTNGTVVARHAPLMHNTCAVTVEPSRIAPP